MSTKIYGGLRLARGVDPFNLPDLLREVLDPIRDRLDAELLLERAVDLHDRAVLGVVYSDEEPWRPNRRPLVAALDTYRAEQAKRAGERDAIAYDVNAFTLFVGRETRTGRHLAVPISRGRAYDDALAERPEFEPYGYWNNTDQPRDVTDSQWRRRRRDWDEVIPWTVGDRMLRFVLRSEPVDMGTVNLVYGDGTVISERFGMLADRDHSLARRGYRISRDRAFTALWRGHEKATGAKPDMSDVWDLQRLAATAQPVHDYVAGLLAPLTIDALREPLTPGDRLAEIDEAARAWVADHGPKPKVKTRKKPKTPKNA